MNRSLAIAIWLASLASVETAAAQPAPASQTAYWPKVLAGEPRPLRYRPEGTDFVIEDSREFFNRPLYGRNTPFRADAGDAPEFSLFLPGRGGNLRLGIKNASGAKWLFDAKHFVARYRPGSMLYEIHDPMLGDGLINIEAVGDYATDGLLVRLNASNIPAGIELIWAFGGVNGDRGSRDGDIGTEREPVSRFFQLRPEYCADNTFSIQAGGFTLKSKTAALGGVSQPESKLAVGDAAHWASPAELLASTSATLSRTPVVVGRAQLIAGTPFTIAVQRLEGANAFPDAELSGGYSAEQLNNAFAAAEKQRSAIANRVSVDTPDPFINAAAAAVNIATDAVWDDQQGAVMHGAVAWRSKLLGWRGPYANDELGWHDRADRHLTYWAGRQNTDPIPDKIPTADPTANLARNEPALKSNGAMSFTHYDMNLPYIDALMRHLLWTGDLEMARKLWPTIQHHLAWEQRLFRRPFGPDKLPLYEAYAAIWSSDDLEYEGGGVAHASAYNYFHNKMAAKIARLLKEDPAPYDKEADLIWKGMHSQLWLADEGCYAEFKDLLGLQLTHPDAAVWTVYHAIDSEAATPEEAWLMARYIDTKIPHIPVIGPGVPEGNYTVSTSDWAPYSWSVNNVVMAESAHTALALFQAGKVDSAFPLLKGCILDSMFLGICPGNLGMTTVYDPARGESQRDFADAAGTVSRAMVEGLFGVRPDLLAGEVAIKPGFPAAWDRASMHHPDFDFVLKREGMKETYSFASHFPKPVKLELNIAALGRGVASATLNGHPAPWKNDPQAIGGPRITIEADPAQKVEIIVEFDGKAAPGDPSSLQTIPSAKLEKQAETPPADAHWDAVDLSKSFNDRVTQIFKHDYLSPRSPYPSLAIPKQGIGAWTGFTRTFDVDDRGLRGVAAANGGKFILPQGVPFATPGDAASKNIAFTSQWDNFPKEAAIPLSGRARRLYLLMAGSTNWMQSGFDNGEVVVEYADPAEPKSERLALRNPTTWWPIDQDYRIDGHAFPLEGPIPLRVDLATGNVRKLDATQLPIQGGNIRGGAATVLELALDDKRELKSLTVRTLANEVVIGLMAATLAR